jgi:hypothetical protein
MRTRGRVQRNAAATTASTRTPNTLSQHALRVALQHLGTTLVTEVNRANINPRTRLIKNEVPINLNNWARLATVSRSTRRLAKFARVSHDLYWAVQGFAELTFFNEPRNIARERATILGHLAKGANPNYRPQMRGRAALHYASIVDTNLHIVKILLEHGANPNMKDTHGLTPLSIAQTEGAHRVAALLKKYGAHM